MPQPVAAGYTQISNEFRSQSPWPCEGTGAPSRAPRCSLFRPIVRSKELPEAVRLLLWQHLPSIDHVAILLTLRGATAPMTPSELAGRVHVEPGTTSQVLQELVAAGLAVGGMDGYHYIARGELDESVGLLQIMYDTRPVTLVRAIYDRPSTVAQLFADAFRIRPREDS